MYVSVLRDISRAMSGHACLGPPERVGINHWKEQKRHTNCKNCVLNDNQFLHDCHQASGKGAALKEPSKGRLGTE